MGAFSMHVHNYAFFSRMQRARIEHFPLRLASEGRGLLGSVSQRVGGRGSAAVATADSDSQGARVPSASSHSVSNKALKDSPLSIRSIASPNVFPTETTSTFEPSSRSVETVSVMKTRLMGDASKTCIASPEKIPCVAAAYTSDA